MNEVTKISSLEKNRDRIRIPSKFLYVPLLISLTIAPALTGAETNINNQNKKEEQSSSVSMQKTPKEKIDQEFIEKANKVFQGPHQIIKVKASQESIDTVAKCISKYKKYPKAAENIADNLGYISSATNSEKAVSDAAKCISKHYRANYFSKFERTEAEREKADHRLQYLIDRTPFSGHQLEYIIEHTKLDGDRLFSSDARFNFILKGEKYLEAAGSIADRLGQIAFETRSEKALLDAILCISKNPEAAREIAYLLEVIAKYSKSEMAILYMAKISKAKTPEEAVKIAEKIAIEVRKK